jgi:hypothetical protein
MRGYGLEANITDPEVQIWTKDNIQRPVWEMRSQIPSFKTDFLEQPVVFYIDFGL